MPKYFMYGSELQELEQLMMLVPNFLPRRSGVIVVQRIKNEVKLSELEESSYLVPGCCRAGMSSKFSKQLAAGEISYGEIICRCFEKCKSSNLNRRLELLVRNYDGNIFLDQIHCSRFRTVCRIQNVSIENRCPVYLATLFLLTADDKLWCAAKDHVYLDSFDFKRMQLKAINTDGYAIYQTARTIHSAKEHIKLDEIADKYLIGDQAFKVIINAILIARYGAGIFSIS